MSPATPTLTLPVASNSTLPGEKPAVAVSVIVPVTEPYAHLDAFYRAYADVLSQVGRSFEFIFVLDGGNEQAAAPLEDLLAFQLPVEIVILPRALGELTVLTVGFERARGALLLILSPDMQVSPQGIEGVLKGLDEGGEVVIARRFPRTDAWLNRLHTRAFHRLLRGLTGVELHDIASGLQGVRREVVRDLRLYGGLHRFLPLLAYQKGFRVTEVNVPSHAADHRTRLYQPGVYLRRGLDLLTLVFLFKFTKQPLRFFGAIGMSLLGAGGCTLLGVGIQRMVVELPFADRPAFILGALLMVLGTQAISIGLLGEMIVFTHSRESQDYALADVLSQHNPSETGEGKGEVK